MRELCSKTSEATYHRTYLVFLPIAIVLLLCIRVPSGHATSHYTLTCGNVLNGVSKYLAYSGKASRTLVLKTNACCKDTATFTLL